MFPIFFVASIIFGIPNFKTRVSIKDIGFCQAFKTPSVDSIFFKYSKTPDRLVDEPVLEPEPVPVPVPEPVLPPADGLSLLSMFILFLTFVSFE